MNTFIRKSLLVTMMVIFILGSGGTTVAGESTRDSDWHFDAGLYFWGASIGGKSTADQSIDVDLDDILDNLEMAFMGVAGLRKGQWSFAADVIYLDVSNRTQLGSGLTADLDLTSWIVTPFAGYNLVDNKSIDFNIIGGARYISLENKLKIAPLLDAKSSGSNWDAIVGIRGGIKLSEHWYLPYHLDIGTGESNITWQAFGGVGYQFTHLDLIVAYRYLSWDFDDNLGLDDFNVDGPMAGIKFRF
jgi:hypothetical protein